MDNALEKKLYKKTICAYVTPDEKTEVKDGELVELSRMVYFLSRITVIPITFA